MKFLKKLFGGKSEEDKLLEEIKKNWGAIEFIENPTEKVQLMAVKQDGEAIEYIKNPSEAVQMEAIQEDPWAIQYIKNPTEKVQLMAIQKDPFLIRYIENPSEAVQMEAGEEYKKNMEYRKRFNTSIGETSYEDFTNMTLEELEAEAENIESMGWKK